MSFFKKFVNKFNKKSVTLKWEEFKNFEKVENIEENNEWPKYEEGDSTLFSNNQQSSSTINDEESFLVITNEENQLLTEIKKLVNKFLLQILLLILIVICNSLIIRVILGIIFLKSLKVHLIQYRLSEKNSFIIYINPFDIMFSQTYISPKFKNGGVVEDMILDLVSGKIKIGNIPLIEVCILDNKIHSSYNRRLYAIQSVIKLGAKIKKIPVLIVRNEYCNIECKYFGSKNLVIENTNFLNVVVNEKYAKNGLL
ncbi:hypothetical protein C2G38_2200209 [Gigaspora rosea]|uniref:Uncharacterized protein n=1 Tax=Gigaspora rosea TaxID=44941 RepID=A0A397UZF1_9GLOM|nr:hypothetical protein C2G38_2200209 [Gigaspora rosea]